MKTLLQIIILTLLITFQPNENQAQNTQADPKKYGIMDQWTMGEWHNPVDNTTLILRPVKPVDWDDLYDNGQWDFPEPNQYEIRMNGQSYTNSYWINGTTMALNNYVTFTILGLDEQNMFIQDSFGGENSPVIQLVRKGTSPVNQSTSPKKINTNHVITLQLSTPQFRKYNKENAQVLTTSNGTSLTEGDFQKSLEIWEYVIGEKLSEFDLQQERQRTIRQFQTTPQQTLQNITANQQTMQQLYQIQNPTALGIARAAIAYGLTSNPQLPDAKEDIALFNKYETILATDQQNGIALLEKDLQGMLNTITFMNKISNSNFQIDATTAQTFRQNAIQNYPNLSVEEKQSIASMHITYQLLAAEWNKMSNEEKQEIAQEMLKNNSTTLSTTSNGNLESAKANLQRILSKGKNSGDSSTYMDANTYQIMSNISLQNHALNMNIIENMGGGGDYWEIRDSYY